MVEPFARRFDDILLQTFLRVLEIENISEDQKLQVQLALSAGGCGLRSHDLKELQRLHVSSALLVAPAVLAATGERIGSAAPSAEEGGTSRHGFIAEETVGIVRKLACLRAAAFELEPAAEIRKWYTILSCCVQRANAKVLRGEARPGERSPVPSRLLLGTRDLAVCGS